MSYDDDARVRTNRRRRDDEASGVGTTGAKRRASGAMDEREGRALAGARGRGLERGENDGDGGGTNERHGWVREF